MGYPWYSERTGNAGKNGQFKISLEKNCETKEIRYVATLIDLSKRTNRKSMSSMDITDLYNKVETYVSKMETVQDGLKVDITEIFNIYGLHNETTENEETKQPEERFMNGEKITNIEFLEICNKYNIELTYSLTNWVTDKLDMIGLGQYEYRAIGKGLFPKELSDYVDQLYEAIEKSKQLEENDITEIQPTKEIKSLKVNKQTETIIVRGYMGKVEQIEAHKIEYEELKLYLYKSKNYYAIYEKQTGKMLVSPKTTKKEVINKLEETLNGYLEKLKDAITATIEHDGYITDYEIGSWIRSA